MNLISRIIRAIFGSSVPAILVAANTAAETKEAAVSNVHEAEAALTNARRNALSQITTAQSNLTAAVETADAEEATREQARTQEVTDTTAEGEAQIQALIRALELARRNADAALANLADTHKLEREEVARRKAAAVTTAAELATAVKELNAALGIVAE